MQIHNSQPNAMGNYVIVEAACRVCGEVRVRLSAADWASLKSCPNCHRGCDCRYVGQGFTSESAAFSRENVPSQQVAY